MNLPEAARGLAWLGAVCIRPASEADLPALEWEGEYAHFRRVYAEVFARTQQGKALMWLAELDGALLGQLFVQLPGGVAPLADPPPALIHSFRVRAALRDRGLGSRLLAYAEADLRVRGYRQASLHVAHSNPAALRLYRRHGYQPVEPVSGEWSYYDHLGYFHEVNEPGWRLLKLLSES